MSAVDCLREGRLQDALQELQAQVRSEPDKAAHRIFLFQLLAVLGDWKRALTQLNVVAELDASALMMAQAYREALFCEAFRAEVFAGRRQPLILGQPPDWLALLLESLSLLHQGATDRALSVQQAALEQASPSAGSINGTRFEWVADADTRLGPVMEVILRGKYYWVPFEYIAEVQTDPPEDLRDVVWLPARMTWQNGGQEVALIPARYPGTVEVGDSELLLGRKTDWVEDPAGYWRGVGQRMLATEQDEYPMLEVRSLQIDPTAAEQTDPD